MSTFKFAKEIAVKFPFQVSALFALVLFSTFLEMIGIALIIPMLGIFLNGTELNVGIAQPWLDQFQIEHISVGPLFSVFLLVIFARSALLAFSQYTIGRIAVDIERNLKCGILKSVLYANWSFNARQNAGKLNNVIAKETQHAGAAIKHLGTYYSSIAITAILMSSSAVVSWEALILALLLALPMFAIARVLNLLTRNVSIARVEANSEASSQLIEISNLMKYLKASAAERPYLQGFESVADRLAKLQKKNIAYDNIVAVLPEVFAAVLIVFLVAISHYLIQRPVADLILFSLLIYRAYANIGKIQRSRRLLISSIPAYEACTKLFEAASKAGEKHGCGLAAVNGLHKEIRLEDVGFQYNGAPTAVLRNINLSLPAKTLFGLAGPSGSGKTTIVDLICGLFSPTTGQVLLDGKDIKTLDIHSWRRCIAYVPQDPILFHGTIRDNIVRGAVEKSRIKLEDACDLAHVTEFLPMLSEGLETVVGDRGLRLSGGQRQRIAIARALMRGAEVLILDEATSSLDSKTELAIQHTLKSLKHRLTIIVIAHRLSMLKDADIICVLRDGQIAEKGSFKELSEKHGEFTLLLSHSNLAS